ncbi:hypothetical protein D910_06144 [Dendroctonus ponderosae]|uniref:Uncharacterized protein n=1 Tax=Dendroctonus ponderosae TaxID=77166 RepID=U4U6R7_DENPD|nr:hypothetical protein D910_06144 [Dendroctonus ponderosae]
MTSIMTDRHRLMQPADTEKDAADNAHPKSVLRWRNVLLLLCLLVSQMICEENTSQRTSLEVSVSSSSSSSNVTQLVSNDELELSSTNHSREALSEDASEPKTQLFAMYSCDHLTQRSKLVQLSEETAAMLKFRLEERKIRRA